MKKLTLLAAFVCCTLVASAQLSGNIEFNKNQSSTAQGFGLGATVQYLLFYDYYFLPGINAGVVYDFGNEEGTTSYNIPIMGMARYYFLGRHSCCGGAYAEGQGGMGIYHSRTTVEEGPAVVSKKNLGQASLGMGYRSPMSYDYNVRMQWVFDGGKAVPYLGLKLGYTF